MRDITDRDWPPTLGGSAVKEALTHVGARETPGFPNTGPIVTMSFSWYHHPPEYTDKNHKPGWAKWCSAFVCYCYLTAMADMPERQAMFKHLASPSTDTLWSNLHDAQMAASCWTMSEVLLVQIPMVPKIGTLIFFGVPGNLHHVEMIMSSMDDGSYQTVGGNVGDRVRISTRSPRTDNIFGFAEIRL